SGDLPALRLRGVRLSGSRGGAGSQPRGRPEPSLAGAHATARHRPGSERRMNQHTSHEPLPDLSPESISRIENAVFAQISDARTPASATTSRARLRRRRWLTGLGVAAAFAAGILVAPPILGIVSSGGGSMSASDSAAYSSG